MPNITRCPKCGYTQLAAPACKSCGAAMGGRSPGVQTGSSAPSKPNPVQAKTPPTKPEPSTAPRAGQASPLLQPFYHGSGDSLFGIHIVNVFLSILTLGIYYFWGKARVRGYLYSQSEFDGDRFAYHGTGKELFIGFLKAFFVFGTIWALFNLAPLLPGGIAVRIAVTLLAYGLLLIFIPMALVGSRRYRLSRSSWRGIRFSFRGSTEAFIQLFVKGALLSLLTLSLYYPYFLVRQYAFMTDHAYFGNSKFAFDGQGKDLFRVYLKAFFMLILWFVLIGFMIPFMTTVFAGLAENWFSSKQYAIFFAAGATFISTMLVLLYIRCFLTAEQQRYFWNHTAFQTARFRSTIDFHSLFLLKFVNLIILLFTFGLGWPWVVSRNIRFTFANLYLEGRLDLETIRQEAQSASPTGEGLESLLDLDTGLGPA